MKGSKEKTKMTRIVNFMDRHAIKFVFTALACDMAALGIVYGGGKALLGLSAAAAMATGWGLIGVAVVLLVMLAAVVFRRYNQGGFDKNLESSKLSQVSSTEHAHAATNTKEAANSIGMSNDSSANSANAEAHHIDSDIDSAQNDSKQPERGLGGDAGEEAASSMDMDMFDDMRNDNARHYFQCPFLDEDLAFPGNAVVGEVDNTDAAGYASATEEDADAKAKENTGRNRVTVRVNRATLERMKGRTDESRTNWTLGGGGNKQG